MKTKTISNRLYWKLSLTFLAILILVGLAYVSITAYFSNKYFEEATQLLNAHISTHLIEEKFQDQGLALSGFASSVFVCFLRKLPRAPERKDPALAAVPRCTILHHDFLGDIRDGSLWTRAVSLFFQNAGRSDSAKAILSHGVSGSNCRVGVFTQCRFLDIACHL